MDQNQEQTVTEEVVQDTQETAPVEAESTPEQPAEETQDQINHRALRELKDKAERERDDALRQLESHKQPNPQKQEVEEDHSYNIAPDEIVEGRHLSVVDKKIKQLEQQLQSYQQQSTTQTVEAKLKNQYPDFDQVVSKENIEILSTAYPELANAIGSSTDLYSKATSAYTLIKKFGIHKTQTNTANIDRVKQNLAKPIPTTSLGTQQGDSPLTKANAFSEGLTPELKKQLYKEMLESMK